MFPSRHLPRFATLCALTCLPMAASAVVTISMQQVGANVVASGSGSADVSALTLDSGTTALASSVWPVFLPESLLVVGVSSPSSQVSVWGNVSGPANFGSGSTQSVANSSTGQRIGIIANRYLYLPVGYVSGSALEGTSTWENSSFASLGVTPGTYAWTWGSGANADSLVLHIGSPVPEPGTWALMLAGVAFLGALASRQRRQPRFGLPAAQAGS